jgi:hypothetical protein
MDASTLLHDVLAAAVSAPADVRRIQHDCYQRLLNAHDWQFAHSDDHRVYELGRAQRRELELARRELDPNYTIWNAVAPASCHNGGGAL